MADNGIPETNEFLSLDEISRRISVARARPPSDIQKWLKELNRDINILLDNLYDQNAPQAEIDKLYTAEREANVFRDQYYQRIVDNLPPQELRRLGLSQLSTGDIPYSVHIGNHRTAAIIILHNQGLIDGDVVIGQTVDLDNARRPLTVAQLTQTFENSQLYSDNRDRSGRAWINSSKVSEIIEEFDVNKFFDPNRDGGSGIVLRQVQAGHDLNLYASAIDHATDAPISHFLVQNNPSLLTSSLAQPRSPSGRGTYDINQIRQAAGLEPLEFEFRPSTAPTPQPARAVGDAPIQSTTPDEPVAASKNTPQSTDAKLGIVHIEKVFINDTEIAFGIQVIERDGAAPIINLFELSKPENSGPSLATNIFEIAPKIKELHFSGHNIGDINWTITNGLKHSGIEFKELDGHLIEATFKQGFTGEKPMGVTYDLTSYNEAATHQKGLEYGMTHNLPNSRWMNSGAPSERFFAIPAPLHPKGVYYMRAYDTNRDVVFVDASRFMEDFKLRDQEIRTISSNPSEILRHMWGNTLNNAQELAQVDFPDDEIRFTNGRHRTSNLAALGARWLPIEVDPKYGEAAKIMDRYGYNHSTADPSAFQTRLASTAPQPATAVGDAPIQPTIPDGRVAGVHRILTAEQLAAAGVQPPTSSPSAPSSPITPTAAAPPQTWRMPTPEEIAAHNNGETVDIRGTSRPVPEGGYTTPPPPPSNPDSINISRAPDGPPVRLNNPVLQGGSIDDGLRTVTPAQMAALEAEAARPTPAAMGKNFTAMGLGLVGLALSATSLYHSVKEGRYGDAFVDATSTAMSAAPLIQTVLPAITNTSSTLSQHFSRAINGLSSVKAVGALTVLTGAFQIANEEEGYKGQRTAAVAITTAAGFAGSAAVTSIAAGAGATGAAALAVAAAPVVLVAAGTTAIAMTADAAIDANKAADSLAQAIRNQEGIKIDTARAAFLEPSGGPSLQKYTNLRQFAVLDGETPGGITPANRQEHSRAVNAYEYSKDPAALDRLEKGIAAKIAHYDKIIEDNTSWYGTSGAVEGIVNIFSTEETDARREAQMERARFMAAQEELKAYREEIKAHEQKLAAQQAPARQQNTPEQQVSASEPGKGGIDEAKWTSYFNPAKLIELANTVTTEFKAAAAQLPAANAPQLVASNESKSTPIVPAGMA